MSRKRTALVGGSVVAIVGSIVVALVATRSEPESTHPNVLIICIDTLRSDHVGVLGGPNDLTPNMDALAARGTTYSAVMSVAPFTAPSVTTICTGVSPLVHGVRSWRDFARGYEGPTLAGTLKAHGYRTAFLGANGFLKPIAPIRDGFERFDEWQDLPAEQLTRRALEDVDAARDDGRPFALWVHYFDPHTPYREHAGFNGRFAFDGTTIPLSEYSDERNGRIVERLYDGEVAYVDRAIGRLLAGLESRGLLENTLVVLTADHGENMADHEPYFGHNDAVFDTLIHVPLIIAGPGVVSGHRDAGLAGLHDLARTTLELAGVAVPIDLGGMSLAASARGGARPPATFTDADSGLQRTRLMAFRTADTKLIRDAAKDPIEWIEFRLDTDPGEVIPLPVADDDPRIAVYEAWIEARKREHAVRLGPERAGPDSRTEEEIEQLRAFGYLR